MYKTDERNLILTIDNSLKQKIRTQTPIPSPFVNIYQCSKRSHRSMSNLSDILMWKKCVCLVIRAVKICMLGAH